MRRVLFVGLALLALSVAVASAAPEKWARGTITALGTDSVTLDVKGQTMTFKVATTTDVVAEGAGTKTREMQRTTGGKPKLTDLLKVGDKVEVQYTESDGAMLASLIRGGVSSPAGTSETAAENKMLRAEGVVTAVAEKSLSIKPAQGEALTFTPDSKIKVVGKGLGTMAEKKEAEDVKMTLTDAVTVGDTVEVYYKKMGEMLHASRVTVLKKGT